MNIYKTKFFARCPANGVRIEYSLTIQTGNVIEVEALISEVESIKSGLHEDIADRLLSAFGGSQVMTADHHGVNIQTIRPHMAHWHPSDPTPSSAAAKGE